jgi:hypothetical protein
VELLLKKNPTFILKVSLFRRYLNIEVGKWNHLININLVLYTKNYLIKMKNEKKLLTEVLKEEKIVTMYSFYTDDSKNKGFNIIKDKIEKANLENYNVLNKIIFVTDDLDILINNIRKECNYDVNEGPQK